MNNSIKKDNLKVYKDLRGKLFFYQKTKYKIQRIFFIEGNKGYVRGDHAHKNTRQVLININAKAIIEIINKNSKKIKFSNAGDIISIPKLNWVKINFKKRGFIAVVCDKKYIKSDYINNFDKFQKLVNKKY